MNVFKKFFSKVGGLLKKVWSVIEEVGVDDEILQYALDRIREADAKYVDNAERREWVVEKLMSTKIPESFARLVTEMAFQLYKKEKNRFGF